MSPSLFERIDAALPALTAAEASEMVQQLLTRAGIAALRLNTKEDALLLPAEAAEIARVPVRRIASWARAAGAEEWAVWRSPRALLCREGAFRRMLQARNERLQSVKRQRARRKRLIRAARKG